jgi:hypothetical protein
MAGITWRRAAGGAALAMLLLTAGCTGGDGEDPASGTAQRPPEDASTAPPEDTPATPPEDAAPTPSARASRPPVTPTPAEDPLATTTIPISTDAGEAGQLAVAVDELQVVGELLRLTVTFVPTITEQQSGQSLFLGGTLVQNQSASASSVTPELIDPVNLKAYELVAGGVANGTSVPLYDGTPITISFYFAAPQDAVEAFDIQLSSQVPILRDVPLSP